MKLFVLSLLAFLTIDTSNTMAAISQQKAIKNENRTVKNFHAIASAGAINVIINISDTESLEIEGQDEDVQRVETVVQNGVLRIRLKRDFKTWNKATEPITIHITAIKLDGLMLSGSGSISLEGEMSSANADIQLSGSGTISANLNTQSANVSISGSGSLDLNGKTGSMNISLSGSGDVNAEELICETSKIKIAGTSNVYIHVKDSIDATLLGTGSVKYLGNPNITTSKIGSGEVVKLEKL